MSRGWFERLRASELGGLAGDSLYMAIWLGAVSVADLIQIALVTHSLGLAEYGRLALVMSFVVLVGQFFDVRVGTAETTFSADRIAAGAWVEAAAVFRLGYGIDAVTGALGFAIVALTAPIVGPWLVGDGGTQLILLFGLTLLASTLDTSSATLLRVMGRFRLLAAYMTGLEALRVIAIAAALYLEPSLTSVLVALIVYDLVAAVVNGLMASRVFSKASGVSLLARPAVRFSERRAMLRTVFHTNVVSYARIAQVQLPTLLLGALTTTTQVGLYKVGAAAGSIVGRVADPLYPAILPRLSRLWALGRRDEIIRILRHSTPLAATLVGSVLVITVAFASPILRLLGGTEALDAFPVLVLIGLGQAIGAVLFWNPSLLFVLGRAGTVSAIAVTTALLQVALLVPLAMAYEANGAALATFVSLVVSNLAGGAVAIRALRTAPIATTRISTLPDQGVSRFD